MLNSERFGQYAKDCIRIAASMSGQGPTDAAKHC